MRTNLVHLDVRSGSASRRIVRSKVRRYGRGETHNCRVLRASRTCRESACESVCCDHSVPEHLSDGHVTKACILAQFLQMTAMLCARLVTH